MDILIIGIISYLMGSIPFGLILTKLFLKKDIREIGSGNIGATNVLRSGNKIVGYTTLILDILKAVIPVIFVKTYYTDFLYLASLCAFLGHVFPVWLKFKGGKGVAVYLGIIVGISFSLGIIFGLAWLLVAIIFRYASLSSIIGSMSVWIYSIFLDNYILTNLLFIIFVIIIFTHKDNIIRLKNSNENKINFKR